MISVPSPLGKRSLKFSTPLLENTYVLPIGGEKSPVACFIRVEKG